MLKTLSIIIPVYNEEAYITRCLENIINTKITDWEKEIIVINDGSTDKTLSLLQKFKSNKIKIISLPNNLGKGNALKKGIQTAHGDILIIQDADLEYDPNDYLVILNKLSHKNIKVVYGSRILGAKIYHNYNSNIFFLWGGLTLTTIINFLFGIKLTDQPTCYKAWKKELTLELTSYCQSNGFEFEVEMTAFFAKKNKIYEVPIRYYPRTINHGKKIKLSDFIKSVFTAFKCKFSS